MEDITILILVVKIIHLALILFVLITPFFNSIPLLIIHIATVISLLLHWSVNNDTCFLTLVEAKLRGINNSESFIHSIVSPVYKFTEVDVNNISYILITILGLISTVKLYKIYKKRKLILEKYNKD